MTDTIYLCGGETGTAVHRSTDCPNAVHDYPLLNGYTDAAREATKCFNHGWHDVCCPDCGIYGWCPGRSTYRLKPVTAGAEQA